ncbi:hypothetical protein EB796_011503 [Bugula neritina]|uniref:Reverse transcriptase domain-containing protein n=1 Tax=Bugula neritina TaxID=10212 RepID=A0A7J7JUX8_BUGNE|nr:hypothetical protein EB796_011503 [Bugula neritina]
MIEDGVNVKVDEPTPWVAPMVVVPKPGQNKVRICTDYTELNKHILREFHPMATVDSSLAQLEKLKASGIRLNKDKCKFGVPSVNFLGYVIDHNHFQMTN